MCSQTTWCYLKAYGPFDGGWIELFVTALGARLQRPEVEAWFFLRYVDDGGVHVRVRARGANTLMQILRDDIEDTLRIATNGAPQARHRVEEASYEPEIDAYGVGTMATAEEVFVESSRIALAIFGSADGSGHVKRRLALHMMERARSAFAGNAPDLFWQRYSDHWIEMVEGDRAALRSTIAARCDAAQRSGRRVLADDTRISLNELHLLSRWADACANAARVYGESTEPVASNPSILAARFVHLMNNRLGISIIEEAHLAALLRSHSPPHCNHALAI